MAASAAEVENLIRNDPFSVHGPRKSREIFHWSEASPDEQFLI
jgi:hypothetical protein